MQSRFSSVVLASCLASLQAADLCNRGVSLSFFPRRPLFELNVGPIVETVQRRNSVWRRRRECARAEGGRAESDRAGETSDRQRITGLPSCWTSVERPRDGLYRPQFPRY